MVQAFLARIIRNRIAAEQLAFDVALRQCLDLDFGVGYTTVSRDEENKWTVLIDTSAQVLELEMVGDAFTVQSLFPKEAHSGNCLIHEGSIVLDVHSALRRLGCTKKIAKKRARV